MGQCFAQESSQVKSHLFKEVKNFSFIDKNDVKKWTDAHVLNWAQKLGFPKDQEEIIKGVIEKEGMDGNDLIQLSYSDVETLLEELEPSIQRDKVWMCIKNVKKNRKFDQRWANVFQKLFRVGSSENLEYLEEYANIISDKSRFYDRYFSFFVDYFEAKELENQVIGFEKEKAKTKNKKEQRKNDVEIKRLQKEIEVLKEKYTKKYEEISGKKFWDGNFASMCGIRRSKIKHLPCKIIVSEIFKDSEFLKKKLRDFLSPIVAILPKYKESTRFGMFHTALIIGPWYLEWNYTEIVVPKRSFGSQKALISYDMPALLNVNYDDLKELTTKIVDIVYFWNTHVFYGQTRKDDEYKGNCQDFIDDLFSGINVSPEVLLKGMFGKFIKSMRTNGKANLEFAPSENFRSELQIKWKTKMFSTHQELDTFFRGVMHRVADVKEKYMEEFYMLKSFDRAFWLRHFRDSEAEEWKPLPVEYSMPEHLRGCPFKDPRETTSYIN